MALLNFRTDVLSFVLVGILGLTASPTNVMSQNCECAPNECCSQYGYCGTSPQYCGPGCRGGPCTTTPTNDVSVGDIVTQEFFDGIQNQAGGDCPGKGFYTRDAFLNALGSFSQFGKTGTVDDSKREIAAFWAHVTHETGYMCYIEENIDNSNNYCNSPSYPCAEGKFYYGRGPLQLTGNGNYKLAGDALNINLIDAPEAVAQDPVLAFKTSLWYWMTYVNSVMSQGFGATIRTINGALECNGQQPDKVQHRVTLYTEYCSKFGVDPGPNLSC